MIDRPLVVVPQHFGALVFDRRTSRYLPFDHAATDWLLSAQGTSVFDLVGQSNPAEQDALAAFASSLYDLGFFGPDGTFLGQRLDADPPPTHLLGPLAVHLEVIGTCNLACTHCFATPLPRRGQMSLAELDVLFAELASLGTFRLGLTGGEVLARRDLFEVIDAALHHGLHPCITTNALLIDEDVARRLGARPLVWLNVSLEGATAASNDRVRGDGVFDRVLERLAILREHARFTLAFTVTADNHAEVSACAALAERLGAHTAVFRPLYPVGAAAQRPEMMPSFDDYTDALIALADPAADLSTLDPFGPHYRADRQARTVATPGCGAANLVASISVDGQVSPCSFLGSDFEAGDVRHAGFRAIWDAGHRFTELRSPAGQRDGFRGGCRARARAATGSAFGPDPWQDAYEARTGRHLPPLCTVERTCGS